MFEICSSKMARTITNCIFWENCNRALKHTSLPSIPSFGPRNLSNYYHPTQCSHPPYRSVTPVMIPFHMPGEGASQLRFPLPLNASSLLHSTTTSALGHRWYASSAQGNSTENKLKEEPVDESKLGLVARFKLMYKQYWYVLIPVHWATSAVWYGSFFIAAKNGVEIVPMLEAMGVTSDKILSVLKDSNAGYYAIAYAMYKLATPARYTVTLAGTTYSINYLKKRGYIKPVPSKEQLRTIYEDKREEMRGKRDELMDKLEERRGELRDKFEERREELRDMIEERRSEMHEKRNELTKRLQSGTKEMKNKIAERSDEIKEKLEQNSHNLQQSLESSSSKFKRKVLDESRKIQSHVPEIGRKD